MQKKMKQFVKDSMNGKEWYDNKEAEKIIISEFEKIIKQQNL